MNLVPFKVAPLSLPPLPFNKSVIQSKPSPTLTFFQIPNSKPNSFNHFNKHRLNMSKATVELDFFGMDQHHKEAASYSSKSQFQKFLHRPRSFRGIHTAMSKINPEAFKSVINSGNASPSIPNPRKSFSVPSSPKVGQVLFPCLPLFVPTGTSVSSVASATSESLQETTPMTIFYNGTVSVFNVPGDKADSILKLALEGNSRKAAEAALAVDPKFALHPSEQRQQLVDPLTEYLPITRSKSLQRFLEKRKERLNAGSPYAYQT